VPKALPELLDPQGRRVRRVIKATLALQGRREPLERRVQKVIKAILELQDRRALKELLARRARKV
jgi:hypothetical protein